MHLPNWISWGSLIAAGFFAGALNSIAGGGTILTFPALIFSGLDPIQANATSTMALIVGILGSLSGYRRYIPRVNSWFWRFIPVSLAGGLLGSMLLTWTPLHFFEHLVPFLILFATGLFMFHEFFNRLFVKHCDDRMPIPASWLSWAIVFQFGVALYGGYFGAGIGILMLASLGILGFRDIHEMNTMKTMLGGLINMVAAIYFAWKGFIDWPRALIVAAASLGGYFVGARFAQSISQTAVRKMITGLGFAIFAIMFYEQFMR